MPFPALAYSFFFFHFHGYSASSSPPEKHNRIALWYTGVTCREHCMFTNILGALLDLLSRDK